MLHLMQILKWAADVNHQRFVAAIHLATGGLSRFTGQHNPLRMIPLPERGMAEEDWDPNQNDSLPELHKLIRDKDTEGLRSYHQENQTIEPLGHPSTAVLAVESSTAEILEYVVENGAEVNYDPMGPWPSRPTPLGRACSRGRTNMVKYLVRKGADLHHTDYAGNGCVNQLALCHVLDPDLLGFLLEQGAQINQQNHRGETAAHLAAECKCGLSLLRRLVENGADINVFNHDGYTPVALAIKLHNVEAVEYLLNNGADSDHCSKWGDDAIRLAALSDSEELLDLLLERFNPSENKRLDAVELFATNGVLDIEYEPLQKTIKRRLDVGVTRNSEEGETDSFYEDVRKIRTLEELEVIEKDRFARGRYALYARECILGRLHPKVSEGFVMHAKDVYTWGRGRQALPSLLRAIRLRHECHLASSHAQELNVECVEVMRTCCSLLLQHDDYVRFDLDPEDLAGILQVACDEMLRLGKTKARTSSPAVDLVTEAMFTFSFIARYCSGHPEIPQRLVEQFLRPVVRENPSTHCGRNLVHYALRAVKFQPPSQVFEGTVQQLEARCKYTLNVLSTLANAGISKAAVDQEDDEGKVPLTDLLDSIKSGCPWVVRKIRDPLARALSALLMAGAHTSVEDHIYILENYREKTVHPQQCADPVSLTCISAAKIRACIRNPGVMLPRQMLDFVFTH